MSIDELLLTLTPNEIDRVRDFILALLETE